MIVWLLILWLAVMAFYGYLTLRRVDSILSDQPFDFTTPEKIISTPKYYGIRFCNGKSRVKKSNRLRYSK